MQADVFCRVIDNFGDIGVTWRLVRQLQKEFGWSVRLCVDDLESFRRIEPRAELKLHQCIDHIQILQWTQTCALLPAPVVLAMFSCELPASYLAQLHTRQTCWLNLEYLSAEDWVEGCHGLPALRADGLAAHFYFPGFTARTGGLIREADLLARRDAWQDDPAAQRSFLTQLGLSDAARQAWSLRAPEPDYSGPVSASRNLTETLPRLISLFCYPDRSFQTLAATLASGAQQTILLVPAGIAPELHAGQYGKLLVERIAFLPQTEYDKVLWTCDLNFVRGEDSIVRALWSGKPLVWQIYPQTENTHLHKLEAWLTRAALPTHAQALMHAWNQAEPQLFSDALRTSLAPENFQQWSDQAAIFCLEQSALPDLASALNTFCQRKQPGTPEA